MSILVEIVLKVIAYALTVGVVQFVLRRINEKREDISINQKGESVIRMDKYVRVFRIMGMMYLALLLVVSFIPGEGQLVAKLVMLLLVIVGGGIFFGMSIMWNIWNITIKQDEIVYCNWFAKKTVMKYAEISKVEIDEYDKLLIYVADKKVFSLDPEVDKQALTKALRKHKISVKHRYKITSFIMEKTKVRKILDVIIAIAGVLLCVFCFGVGHLVAGIVTGICMVAAIISVPVCRSHKIRVEKDRIYIQKFLRKTKIVSFADVANYRNTYRENMEYVTVYCRDGYKFKYPKQYTNAKLFDRLIAEQHWKKR